MRKIKIFRSSNTKSLEEDVNEWLEENYDEMTTQPTITYLQTSVDSMLPVTTAIIDYFTEGEE